MMQMIQDALSPERLAEFRRDQQMMTDLLTKAPPDFEAEKEATTEKLNDALRAKHDQAEEEADRRAFEEKRREIAAFMERAR